MAMDDPTSSDLSRRQRQIIEVLYEYGEASAEEIRGRIRNPPSNSAIRATLKVMEDRGLLKKREHDFRYLYNVVEGKEEIQRSAMERLVRMFFNNSAEQAALALLGTSKEAMSAKRLARIRTLIEDAKKEG